MRTLHINIASRPYRDYRPVWAVALAMAVVSAILLMYNVRTAWQYLVETKETRAQIAAENGETQREQRRSVELEASLRRFDIKKLTEETSYVNGHLRERAFSWSELLDDLEAVVPRDVRLLSLNPAIDKTRIRLSMTARSRKGDGMVQMLNNLLQNPHFDRPFPNVEEKNDDGTFRFSLDVDYRPDPPGVIE